MNSIAIWSDKNEEFKCHLDINLWITKEKNDNYIEFGFKLSNLNINSLFLFLPFKFDTIEDKVEELQKPDFLNAMFNDSLSANNLNNGSFIEIKKENEVLFHFCKLTKQDFKIDNSNNEGNILKININKSNKSIEKIYYRFRINKLDNIFEESNINWFFTNGIKEKINFIEVSINSVRKLPSHIVDNIETVKIDSMNIFIMTESFINLLFNSKAIEKSRVLEKVWKEYVEAKNINKIIAYHWKKDNIFKDYNLFIKTSYIDKSKRLIFGMIFAMFIIGIAGGVAGNFGTDLVKNKIICKKENNETNSTKTK